MDKEEMQFDNEDKAFLKLLGQRLAIRRSELGMSQEELAEKVGLSSRTIYTAENGIQALRVNNLSKICKVLKISPNYIMDGNIGEPEHHELKDLLSKFSPYQVKLIKYFLKEWKN